MPLLPKCANGRTPIFDGPIRLKTSKHARCRTMTIRHTNRRKKMFVKGIGNIKLFKNRKIWDSEDSSSYTSENDKTPNSPASSISHYVHLPTTANLLTPRSREDASFESYFQGFNISTKKLSLIQMRPIRHYHQQHPCPKSDGEMSLKRVLSLMTRYRI